MGPGSAYIWPRFRPTPGRDVALPSDRGAPYEPVCGERLGTSYRGFSSGSRQATGIPDLDKKLTSRAATEYPDLDETRLTTPTAHAVDIASLTAVNIERKSPYPSSEAATPNHRSAVTLLRTRQFDGMLGLEWRNLIYATNIRDLAYPTPQLASLLQVHLACLGIPRLHGFGRTQGTKYPNWSIW